MIKTACTLTTIYLITCYFNFCLAQQQKTDSLQTKNDFYQIITKDKQKYFGEWVNTTNNKLLIVEQPSGDTIYIFKNNIKSFKLSRGTHLINHSSDYARYIINSPAYNVKADELIYSQQSFFYSSLTYGVTDNFSIELGSSIPFLLGGSVNFLVTPKVKLLERRNFSLGSSLSFSTLLPSIFEDGFSITILSVYGTLGTERKNLTFGIGYGIAEGEALNSPQFQLSGLTYLTERTSLVLDSQIVGLNGVLGDLGVFSVLTAVRLKRNFHTFDIGLQVVGEVDQFGPYASGAIPHIGYNLDIFRKNE